MAKEYFAIVDGYVFRSSEEAKQARKEVEGIRFVKEQMDMGNPKAVLQVYNRMLQDDLFQTEVGYSFLRELQSYLMKCPEIETDAIRALEMKKQVVKKNYVAPDIVARMKHRLITTYIIIGIFALLVVSMIIIMQQSDNATILNYENKVIDRYEHWQKDLEEREKELKEKEKELQENKREENTP